MTLSCKTSVDNTSCPQNGPGLDSTAINGKPGLKELSLTFTHSPGGKTLEIINYLYSEGIQATFFASGSAIEEHGDELLEAKRKGHLVGNSGYSGKSISGSESLILNYRRVDQLIRNYVSGNIFLLRDPGDSFSAEHIQKLNESGFRKYTGPIQWDIGGGHKDFKSDSECWQENIDIGTCLEHYHEPIKSLGRGIVAFHSNSGKTLDLLRSLIPALKSSGYTFIRVDKIPEVRARIQKNGGIPDTISGGPACDDY